MVYLDNNATTPIDTAVSEKMSWFLKEHFGNPSSMYPIGREVKKLITKARETVADALGAMRSEIIFTGSGTESDNFAILGIMNAFPEKNEFITSSIEHPAVIETASYLEKKGKKITFIPVDHYGNIDLEFLKKAISPKTALISVMYSNNELGTIEPIKEVVKIAKEKEVLVHTDAVQAFGKIPCNVNKLGVDLLSISAHKIYGPKGIGALYIRKGTKILPLIWGGQQERNLRAGTENTAGIIALGEAVRIFQTKGDKDLKRINKLADRLKKSIEERIPRVIFNGPEKNRVKSTLSFSFTGMEAEAILLALASKEIYVSTGSACSEDSEDVSHVLNSIGLKPEVARSTLRLSLGRFNNDEDISKVLNELPEIIEKLRKISGL